MSYLFIKDAQTEQETHSSLIENTLPITESFSDIIDSFLTTAERKLTGYSIGEIDILAKAAKNVDSEVKKRDLLKRIDAAITDVKKEFFTSSRPTLRKNEHLHVVCAERHPEELGCSFLAKISFLALENDLSTIEC